MMRVSFLAFGVFVLTIFAAGDAFSTSHRYLWWQHDLLYNDHKRYLPECATTASTTTTTAKRRKEVVSTLLYMGAELDQGPAVDNVPAASSSTPSLPTLFSSSSSPDVQDQRVPPSTEVMVVGLGESRPPVPMAPSLEYEIQPGPIETHQLVVGEPNNSAQPMELQQQQQPSPELQQQLANNNNDKEKNNVATTSGTTNKSMLWSFTPPPGTLLTATTVSSGIVLIATRQYLQQRQCKIEEQLKTLRNETQQQEQILLQQQEQTQQQQSNLLFLSTLGSVVLGAVVAATTNVVDNAMSFIGESVGSITNSRESMATKGNTKLVPKKEKNSASSTTTTTTTTPPRVSSNGNSNNPKMTVAATASTTNAKLPYLEQQIQDVLQSKKSSSSKSLQPQPQDVITDGNSNTNNNNNRRPTSSSLSSSAAPFSSSTLTTTSTRKGSTTFGTRPVTEEEWNQLQKQDEQDAATAKQQQEEQKLLLQKQKLQAEAAGKERQQPVAAQEIEEQDKIRMQQEEQDKIRAREEKEARMLRDEQQQKAEQAAKAAAEQARIIKAQEQEEAMKKQQRIEEEARIKAKEEQDRIRAQQEEARIRAEQEQARIQAEQEQARIQAEQEKAEQAAKAAEQARIKAQEQEQALKKQQAEEEARMKAQKEEEALKKQQAEEEARIKAQKEEEGLKKQQAEEEARIKAQKEEEALKKQQAEEEARIKAQKEELALLQALETERKAAAAKAAQQLQEPPKNRVMSAFEQWQRKQAELQKQTQQSTQQSFPSTSSSSYKPVPPPMKDPTKVVTQYFQEVFGINNDDNSNKLSQTASKEPSLLQNIIGTGDEAIFKAAALTAAGAATAAAAGNALRITRDKGASKLDNQDVEKNVVRGAKPQSVGDANRDSTDNNNYTGSSFQQVSPKTPSAPITIKSESKPNDTTFLSTPPTTSKRPTVAMEMPKNSTTKTPPSSISFEQQTPKPAAELPNIVSFSPTTKTPPSQPYDDGQSSSISTSASTSFPPTYPPPPSKASLVSPFDQTTTKPTTKNVKSTPFSPFPPSPFDGPSTTTTGSTWSQPSSDQPTTANVNSTSSSPFSQLLKDGQSSFRQSSSWPPIAQPQDTNTKPLSPFARGPPKQAKNGKQPFSPFAKNEKSSSPLSVSSSTQQDKDWSSTPKEEPFNYFMNDPRRQTQTNPQQQPSRPEKQPFSPFGPPSPKPSQSSYNPFTSTPRSYPNEKQSISPFDTTQTKKSPPNPFLSTQDSQTPSPPQTSSQSLSSSSNLPNKTLSPFGSTSSTNASQFNPFTSSVQPKMPPSSTTSSPKPQPSTTLNQSSTPPPTSSSFGVPPKSIDVSSSDQGVYRPPNSGNSVGTSASSPSQEDWTAKQQPEAGESKNVSPFNVTSKKDATQQQQHQQQQQSKTSFSPFGRKPTAATTPPKSKTGPETIQSLKSTSSFGVAPGSKTLTSASSFGGTFGTKSPFDPRPSNIERPATTAEGKDVVNNNIPEASSFGFAPEASSFGVAPDTKLRTSSSGTLPKSSVSPFGLSSKSSSDTKELPKAAQQQSNKAKPTKTSTTTTTTPAFGVSADAKFRSPDTSKSTLSTSNQGLRPPPKAQDVTKRDPVGLGRFNLGVVNERVDEASSMSRDEKEAADAERERIKDLQKARDRVMNILSGGLGGGINEGKESLASAISETDVETLDASQRRRDTNDQSAPSTSNPASAASAQSFDSAVASNKVEEQAKPNGIQDSDEVGGKQSFAPFSINSKPQIATNSVDVAPKRSFSPFGAKPQAPTSTGIPMYSPPTVSTDSISDGKLSDDESDASSTTSSSQSESDIKSQKSDQDSRSLHRSRTSSQASSQAIPNSETMGTQASFKGESSPSDDSSISRDTKKTFSPFGDASKLPAPSTVVPKKSFSPFGGSPKRPAAVTSQNDLLYAPPSSTSPFVPAKENDPSSSPLKSSTSSDSFTTQPKPSPKEEATKAELLSKDEEPNERPVEQSQPNQRPSFLLSDAAPVSPSVPPRPLEFSGAAPRIPFQTNEDVQPNVLSSFDPGTLTSQQDRPTSTRPRKVQPGSLSSTVKMDSLPFETPAKPIRPYAASTIPRDTAGPVRNRGRLMDLESTRKMAMDQMEGSLVEKLQPLVRPAPPRETSSFRPSRAVTREQETSQQQQLQPAAPSNSAAVSESNREKILNAILAADDNYIPSNFAMEADMPGVLLQEVMGAPLANYNAKEDAYSGKSVNIQGGSSLSIPVRVTIPGSLVSYTIERKSTSDNFSLAITSQFGLDQVETVKPRAPFGASSKNIVGRSPPKVVTDNLLVSAGSTPCTLQFELDNSNAMSIEVAYRIRVIPPPPETVREGRQRRSHACLQVLESDLQDWLSRYSTVAQELNALQNEVQTLEDEFRTVHKSLREAREDEWRAKIDAERDNQNKPPEDWI